MGTENIIYLRPSQKYIVQAREPVDETCPECGSRNVAKYPIVHHLGPRITVTCQDCLYRLHLIMPTAKDRWPPYWPVTTGWPPSSAG